MTTITETRPMIAIPEDDAQIALVALDDYLDGLRRREYLAQADSNGDLAERLRDDIREVRAAQQRIEAALP